MKKVKTKKLTKKIICLIIILMLCNFIMPIYSHAVDTEEGGSLSKVMGQFLCYIPDAVIDFLQDMFVTTDGIRIEDQNYNIRYSIKYSPGVIFSGQVPALDINFINPGESRPKQIKETQLLGMDADPNVCIDESLLQIINQLGYKNEGSTEEGTVGSSFEEALSIIKNYLDNQKNWNANKESDDIEINGDIYVLYCNPVAETARWQWHFENQNSMDMDNPEGWVSEAYCEYNGSICNQNDIYDSIKLYIEDKYGNGSSETGESSGYNEFKEEIRTKLQEEIADVEYGKSKEVTLQNGEKTVTVYLSRGGIQVNNKDVYHINVIRLNDNGEYSSSAAILQSIVATWYNALRRIALVGLLSALIYIGIRILLTSTSAKDKAKYKNMLKDWLVALCLLFTLHYIMSITITVVGKINEVIMASSIATNGEDILMTSVRNAILNGESWGEVLVFVVIYFVLAVYTIIYTIQYIRRVIHLAFLTMIAPLITLTYPLDKIKDSKSQAFDMWIKDYIFFSLIQVVHLLIYYIFVGSSIDLANKGNWLYAIVAIGFIVPAEKLIKKMFGFEKSKTLGAMSAGATGALVMNAIQKLPHDSKEAASGKQKSSEGGSTKAVRTAGVNPFVNFTEGGSAGGSAGTPTQPTPSSSSSSTNEEQGNSDVEKVKTNSQVPKTPETEKESKLAQILKSKKLLKNDTFTSFRLNVKRNIKGVKAVAGKYFAPVTGGTIRLMAGATGAVIGLSAGVAQGDVGKAISGLAIGATAGKGVVNVLDNTAKKVGQIPEKVNGAVDTFREGAYGREVAQNAKFDRVFRNSQDYKELKESSGFSDTDFDRKVQKMLDSGITDTKQMKKILKNHKLNPKRYNMDDAIKYSQMAKKCTEDILYDKVKFIRFCQDRKLNLSEEELIELRKDIMNFK